MIIFTFKYANLFPPSNKIRVVQYQSLGLVSGGVILPSIWNVNDEGTLCSISTSAAGDDAYIILHKFSRMLNKEMKFQLIFGFHTKIRNKMWISRAVQISKFRIAESKICLRLWNFLAGTRFYMVERAPADFRVCGSSVVMVTWYDSRPLIGWWLQDFQQCGRRSEFWSILIEPWMVKLRRNSEFAGAE